MPWLLSCADNSSNFYRITQQKKGKIDSYHLPNSALNDVVKGLAYEMLKNSSFVTPKTPIAVASFVNLKNLESTNWLGMQLSEDFIHELQRHGMVVVDFKATGYIRVTKSGDFVLSRDWQELPERQIIDYVVTGTMMEQENGVMVNARMVGMQSRVVVATSQAFIPNWAIGKEITPEQRVKMKDGMLIRDQAKLAKESRAVEIRD